MKKIAVLGSTGSIGRQALEVVAAHQDKLKLVCIAARTNYDLLMSQAKRFDVDTVILTDGGVDSPCLLSLEQYAEIGDYDVLLVAVSGPYGLLPTLAALRRGKTVALANKEALLLGGKFVLDAIREGGGMLLPVDSEHSAMHQCLLCGRSVDHLVITCSGGALRNMPIESLGTATIEQVLAHPTWDMGVKITIDCATMVNKAFEVAEAHYLFQVDYDSIEVVMHPESIVHSMVRFADGSVLAQMANPDMRLPIQYALLYPDCVISLVKPLDFGDLTLHFYAPQKQRYPLFWVGLDAFREGGKRAIAYVAADEAVTKAFAKGSICYDKIHTIIVDTVARFAGKIEDIPTLWQVYRHAYDYAEGLTRL